MEEKGRADSFVQDVEFPLLLGEVDFRHDAWLDLVH